MYFLHTLFLFETSVKKLKKKIEADIGDSRNKDIGLSTKQS